MRKQQYRQEVYRRERATFRGGIGLGLKAGISTKASHIRQKHELRKDLFNGKLIKGEPMTTEDYLNQKNLIKKGIVAVPTRSVRRSIRSERVGALYKVAHAAKLPLKMGTAVRKSKTERDLKRVNNKADKNREARIALENEISRRIAEKSI